jgi:transposase
MAPPPKERLRVLADDERATLTRVGAASSERVDRVRRATALLAVAAGLTCADAARRAGFRSGTAVADLVARFNRRGLAALASAPGRGPKVSYGPAARAPSVATAPRPPARRDDGTATWSRTTLRRTLRRAARPAVGATTVRRVRHAAGSSSQRPRPWGPTGTALRQRQAGVVRVVDPETEVTRGGSRGPLGRRRRRAGKAGVTRKPGHPRRSRSRGRAGGRWATRRGSRTRTAGVAPPSCCPSSARRPARCGRQG